MSFGALLLRVWADTSKAGVTGHAAFALMYTGNTNLVNDLTALAPVNGIANYPDHIQTLWTRDRGATIGGDGRVAWYDEVMIGDPRLGVPGYF